MSSPSEPIASRTKHEKRDILLGRQLVHLAEWSSKWKKVGTCALLPRSMEVEHRDFDVDIELIRVADYAVYGLVYHCVSDTMATSPFDV
jgi:hypothetical protein